MGDLAASTFLREKKEFYARFIGDKSTISELSVAVPWATQTVKDRN